MRSVLASLAFAACSAAVLAQVPGRNVNMVSGTTSPGGDPYLQRQNEPSIAASTRNPLHLLAGANDYRTVDLPGLPNSNETGDAWMGVFKSFDGGNTWRSTLIPGYPQDAGSTSPLRAYSAAADPVVRAGTNGLFYYSGIVFDRSTPAKSAMFVSRFIDNNNQEAGDPIVFLGTSLIATNDGTAFIDKPWFAVDVPRTGAPTCTINTSQKSPTATDPNRIIHTTQSFPGGAAYAVFSLIVETAAETRSQLYFSRSLDCGATWSPPQQISSSADPINQGGTMAIDPRNGTIYLAWRRFTADGTDDSIMVVRSLDQGRKWDPPGRARRFPRGRKVGLTREIHGKRFTQPTELTDLASLDQRTETYQFRTNAYPSMTVDGSGRVYVVWSERGFAPLNTDADDGDARILIATSTTGTTWTEPSTVANDALAGHQVMPSLSFAGGKLMVGYYDFREDVSLVFRKFVDETSAIAIANKRHTVDVRAAMADPAAAPAFHPSVRVSEYLMGSRPGAGPRPVEQLQFNPPNLKLFKLGTVPFIGDYIDLAPSPSFVPAAGGGWAFNTAPASSPLFHLVWTDNRDVVPPANGDWTSYTPPGSTGGPSSFDPTQTLPVCMPGREGMRNQNIYTARITGGLVAGSPGNTKPLSPLLPRAFVVFAQNATDVSRSFRLTIENQPAGGRASFLETPLPPYDAQSPPPLTILDVIVPARSTVARNVYVTSTDPHAQVRVAVKETGASGQELPSGLGSTVILNPDISNPDISNPDISNPDISNPDISNAEVANPDISNPDISNPDISNPDISNPDISNPDISNPDISNVQVANPDISNPDISNPDISNPDISNPDISNPDISNPDISNQSLTDTSWTVTNNGNTTTSYSVQLLLNGAQPAPDQVAIQLVLHKVYTTPVAVNCTLALHAHNVLLANITRPRFLTSTQPGDPNVQDPSAANATLWLAPGETAKITLRVMDKNLSDGITFDAVQQVTPAVVAQALDVSLVNGTLVVAPAVEVAVPPAIDIAFGALPQNAAAGAALGQVGVTVTDPQGAVVPGVVVALSVHTVPGDAQVGPTLNAVSNASGQAVFNLSPLPAGRYRLEAVVQAIGYPLTTGFSDSFVIYPGVLQWAVDAGGNGNYYEYVRDGGLTWEAARTAAAARSHAGFSGRLVTVTSAAENAFVNALRGEGDLRAWIGMHDPDGSGDAGFAWISGEPLTYTNWAAGEPDNPGTEFFVEMSADGTWKNSVALDGALPTLGYLVEYAVTGSTFTVTSTADAGAGTLRQALLDANANGASKDAIVFDIPDAGPHIISLSTPLPFITQPVGIDGTTQPGYSGVPLVFIDGADAGPAPGLRVEAASTEIRRIGIIGFTAGPGIQLWTGGNAVVRGNYIGLTGTGLATGNQIGIDVHGAGHQIGGNGAEDRNVISGNNLGIFLQSDSGGATIIGNYIGTSPNGTSAVPNITGILADDTSGHAIGGGAPADGNLISGNGDVEIQGNGIMLTNASGNSIRGNLIGVAADGTTALPNTGNGIRATGASDNNTLETNTIAFNLRNGVELNGVGNAVKLNSIFGNGLLGIDQGGGGVTANDAGEADGIQNYPVLTSAQALPGSFRVTGTFSSSASTLFEIRFFDNATCDPSGFGEGQRQVGVTDFPTNADGNGVFDITFPFAVPAGRALVATARNWASSNTSEFSQCVIVQSPEPPAPGGAVR
ncbi:MAG TPA: lectin-like protein [Vicinamibacterales bacterium]|nr:lectin-like protein [Vicinamibacterales bacterium]